MGCRRQQDPSQACFQKTQRTTCRCLLQCRIIRLSMQSPTSILASQWTTRWTPKLKTFLTSWLSSRTKKCIESRWRLWRGPDPASESVASPPPNSTTSTTSTNTPSLRDCRRSARTTVLPNRSTPSMTCTPSQCARASQAGSSPRRSSKRTHPRSRRLSQATVAI